MTRSSQFKKVSSRLSSFSSVGKHLFCILVWLLLSGTANSLIAQPTPVKINFITLNKNTPTGIRAISVVNDSVIWVGGSHGFVGKSIDGGNSWNWMHPDNDSLDFRSLKSFDKQNAIVVNAGSPAFIFRTEDGGNHWEKVYTNRDSAIFLDGMVFKNRKEGMVYGDPMNGRFVILKTKDGGKHWKMQPLRRRPKAIQGEASFAASNSAIFSLPASSFVWIATGGSASRVFFSKNFGKRWKIFKTGMLHGKSSTGIFSLAFINKNTGVCVGGDYTADSVRLMNAVLTRNGGITWQKPIINPYGYRSCVAYLSPDTLLATGTSGTDMSFDGGLTWHPLSKKDCNIIGISPTNQRKIYLAGAHGKIVRLEFSTKYEGKNTPPLKHEE